MAAEPNKPKISWKIDSLVKTLKYPNNLDKMDTNSKIFQKSLKILLQQYINP